MWIEEIKKDSEVVAYKFVERFKNPHTGKEQRISIRSKKNTPTIRKEMPDLLKEKFEKNVKLLPTTDSVTFQELTDMWLNSISKSQKPSTHTTTKSNVNAMCKYIGMYQISILDSIIVNQMFQSMLKHNKYSTIKIRKVIFNQLWNYGYNIGLVTNIALPNKIILNKPSKGIDKKEWKYLEHDELEYVLSKTKRPEYNRLFRLMVMNGWRIGEICSIDYEKDIDFVNKTISINKTYNWMDNKFYLPKNNKTRITPINDTTIELIKEQIEYDQWKKARYNIDSKNNLLFKTIHGNPTNIRIVNKYLKKIHIPNKTLSTHIFRHTFITYMIEQNVPLMYIAQHVGHADTQMIERVYKHFSNSMQDKLHQYISDFNI